MPLKKILIIIISILLIILIWLFYNIWKNTQGEKEISGRDVINRVSTTATIVPTTKQKLTQLTSKPIIGLVIADQKLKYFDKQTGHLFEMYPDGTRQRKIISSDIPNLTSAIWDSSGTKAVLQTQEKQYFYDFATNQVLLVNFINPVWLGNKIVYKCSQGICQSDADGFNEKIIFKTKMQDFNLVSDNQNIYIYQKPSAKAPSTVYLIGKQIKKILGPHYGLIFKSLDNYSIGLEPYGTIADKCISNYCAVPQNLAANALMPDDYYKNLLKTKDAFWDIKNKKEIIKTSYDAENLLVFENKLYFTDKNTGYLYMIRLSSE